MTLSYAPGGPRPRGRRRRVPFECDRRGHVAILDAIKANRNLKVQLGPLAPGGDQASPVVVGLDVGTSGDKGTSSPSARKAGSARCSRSQPHLRREGRLLCVHDDPRRVDDVPLQLNRCHYVQLRPHETNSSRSTPIPRRQVVA